MIVAIIVTNKIVQVDIYLVIAHYCNKEQFKCLSGSCIPIEGRCNGLIECNDQSDEQNCNHYWWLGIEKYSSDSSCYIICNHTCIARHQLCDGIVDCFDFQDELDCCIFLLIQVHLYKCNNLDDIKCIKDNICYTKEQRCDGYFDCPDKSDEFDCRSLHIYNLDIDNCREPFILNVPTLSAFEWMSFVMEKSIV